VFADDTVSVRSVTPSAIPVEGTSIVSELTGRRINKLVGLLPYRLEYQAEGNGRTSPIEVMVKVKPLDREIMLAATGVAAVAGERLRESYARFGDRTGFAGSHVRELMVCRQTDPRFTKHAPVLYDTVHDDGREAYVLVMERLVDVTHLDSGDDVSGWNRCHVEAALQGVAEVHAIWYGREDELRRQPWLGPVQSAQGMTAMTELWQNLAVHAFEEFPDLMSGTDLASHLERVDRIPEWWREIESMPKTLIHNDFNPRNIAFRKVNQGRPLLCAYDWELATLHLPQHDLAELLSFVLTSSATAAEVSHYVEVHRRALEEATGSAINSQSWRRGFMLCLADLSVNRIPHYLMAHTVRHYAFMDRLIRTTNHLLALDIEA
jgi:hypothetical protein